MTIRLYKAYTPGTRNRSVLGFEEIAKSNPQKKLTFRQHNKQGRNNREAHSSSFTFDSSTLVLSINFFDSEVKNKKRHAIFSSKFLFKISRSFANLCQWLG